MGNRNSKNSRSKAGKSTDYRALSSCSDADSMSVTSISANPAVAKRLSQVEPTGFSNSAINYHCDNNTPLAILSNQHVISIPIIPEESATEMSPPLRPSSASQYREILRNNENNEQPPKATCRIKSPVPISRLKLDSSSPPPGDKINLEYKVNRCRYERSTSDQQAPICWNAPPPAMTHRPNSSSTYPTATNYAGVELPPLPTKGQRGGRRNLQQPHHIRQSSVQPFMVAEDERRLVYKLNGPDPATGRLSDANVDYMLRCVNTDIKSSIDMGQPLASHEGYKIEVKITRTCSAAPTSIGNLWRAPRHEPDYAVPQRSHPQQQQQNPSRRGQNHHSQRNYDHRELAQLVAQNHERNKIPLSAVPKRNTSFFKPGEFRRHPKNLRRRQTEYWDAPEHHHQHTATPRTPYLDPSCLYAVTHGHVCLPPQPKVTLI